MANLRTTIVLPEEDVKYIKVLAATHGLTMSEVIRKSVKLTGGVLEKRTKTQNKDVGWRSVVGSLNLGGKEPYKKRSDLYEKHLRRKFSR